MKNERNDGIEELMLEGIDIDNENDQEQMVVRDTGEIQLSTAGQIKRALGIHDAYGLFRLRACAGEFHDQAWCPDFAGKMLRESLRNGIVENNIYQPAAAVIERMMREMDCNEIIDLCSGAGGPWEQLEAELSKSFDNVRVTLSDKYPAKEGIIEMDAMNPGIEGKIRTMFTALHHFSPEQVVQILSKAIEDEAGFAAFEITERSLLGIVGSALVGFVSTFKYWAKNRENYNLLQAGLTAIIHTWDGGVSSLNTYSEAELRVLAKKAEEAAGSKDYSWEIGTLKNEIDGFPVPIVYIAGTPGKE